MSYAPVGLAFGHPPPPYSAPGGPDVEGVSRVFPFRAPGGPAIPCDLPPSYDALYPAAMPSQNANGAGQIVDAANARGYLEGFYDNVKWLGSEIADIAQHLMQGLRCALIVGAGLLLAGATIVGALYLAVQCRFSPSEVEAVFTLTFVLCGLIFNVCQDLLKN